MPLDSNSTRDEVLDAYDDNVSYRRNGSIAQAYAFIEACTMLLSPRRSIKRSSHGGRSEEVELDLETQVRQPMLAAEQWLAANAPALNGSGVIHPDFTGFRE
jgi:hypothetical protein